LGAGRTSLQAGFEVLGEFARPEATAAIHVADQAGTHHATDWGVVLTQAGLWIGIVGAIAAVIAIVPQTREFALAIWRRTLLRAGFPRRHYAKKFIVKHGTYDNPYVRLKEKRDLTTTYVPLSFQSGDVQSVTIATTVLGNLPADRIVIVGDPGSGKSTLLKAYGVSALQGQTRPRRRRPIVPYLVPLRDFAAFLLTGKGGLSEFITSTLLKEEYGAFGLSQAEEFFNHTVERDQAIVMLDGLDEVPDDSQHAILTAVLAFTRDMSPERHTGQVKLVLTCRAQNFAPLRENWLPAFANEEAVYALAPLRDSEIVGYLLKLRSLFKTADGPARFLRSVRESKTIDLLRAPLILAIAVGLYAERPTLIPSTIAELYRNMIDELLDRHRFRHEKRTDESLLSYRREDKYRFLRQFALFAACESGNFADFSRSDLEQFAVRLAPALDAVSDPVAMVTEIIQHSGLLTDAGHGCLWHFAHRSIHEFLAAEDLRLSVGGDAVLLERAMDANWRQAIQFYTAGQEARQVDGFLYDLAKRNAGLAAYCLLAAKPSDEAAHSVLDALKLWDDGRVGALAAASRSPRVAVQRMAIWELERFIADSPEVFSAARTGIDGVLPLLQSLASTSAANIASIIPFTIRHVPDDPRLVGPLWQCLSANGIELLSSKCSEIVQRLLAMVTEPNAFAELERQDPHDREFLRPLRTRAYPFEEGLSRDHNLVTLLAWVEYLGITPDPLNRFLAARAAGRLHRIETDRQRTISFSLGWPTRVATSLLCVAAFGVSVALLVAAPGMLLHPFGWWTLGLIFGIAFIPNAIFAAWETSPQYFKDNINPHFSLDPSDQDGHILTYLEDLDERLEGIAGWLYSIIIPASVAISPIPLVRDSLAIYLTVAICSQLFFVLTFMRAFDFDMHYYPYRPNEYVDMYEDERSRLWLRRPVEPSLDVASVTIRKTDNGSD
jgi:hypothetical protein